MRTLIATQIQMSPQSQIFTWMFVAGMVVVAFGFPAAINNDGTDESRANGFLATMFGFAIGGMGLFVYCVEAYARSME